MPRLHGWSRWPRRRQRTRGPLGRRSRRRLDGQDRSPRCGRYIRQGTSRRWLDWQPMLGSTGRRVADRRQLPGRRRHARLPGAEGGVRRGGQLTRSGDRCPARRGDLGAPRTTTARILERSRLGRRATMPPGRGRDGAPSSTRAAPAPGGRGQLGHWRQSDRPARRGRRSNTDTDCEHDRTHRTRRRMRRAADSYDTPSEQEDVAAGRRHLELPPAPVRGRGGPPRPPPGEGSIFL